MAMGNGHAECLRSRCEQLARVTNTRVDRKKIIALYRFRIPVPFVEVSLVREVGCGSGTEGSSVVRIVFSEAFVASLAAAYDKFAAACFSSLEPVQSKVKSPSES